MKKHARIEFYDKIFLAEIVDGKFIKLFFYIVHNPFPKTLPNKCGINKH